MAKNLYIMPYNLEAEQALIGCMLIDNDIQAVVLDQVSEEDFYQESHQLIIKAMKLSYAGNKLVDLVILADALEKDKNLENAGGITYITELTQIVPSSANYKYYLEIVKRDSTSRRLIKASNSIIEYSQKGLDQENTLAFAEKQVYDISAKNDSSNISNIAEDGSISQVFAKFEKLAKNKDAFKGVLTGFSKLDEITNGLQPSDLIVIAARPGMGKTSLAMNIIENAAIVENKICAVFSLEMPRIQLAQRLVCSHARVSMSKALKGGNSLSPEDWKKLWKASDDLNKSKIFVDDSSKTSPAQILSKCRRLKAQNGGLDMIMIDYIQLMEDKSVQNESRQLEIASITRNLKIIAKELNVPVIALSQLRRIGKEEPQLSDLRESGAIEQDADMVMFINRPDVTATEADIQSGKIEKGMAELIIAKHRNGELDRIKLRFKGECTRFVNYVANLPEAELTYAEEEAIRYDNEIAKKQSDETRAERQSKLNKMSMPPQYDEEDLLPPPPEEQAFIDYNPDGSPIEDEFIDNNDGIDDENEENIDEESSEK